MSIPDEPRGPLHTPRSIRRRTLDGLGWLSMGNGVRAVSKIVVLAVLGRLLTPADFGVVAAAGVIVWLSMIFSNLGVGPALVQRRDLTERHTTTAFTVSLLFGVLLGGLVYVLAPPIADAFRIVRLVPVLRALTVVFPIAAVSVVAQCLLQRELRFRVIAAAELASYVLGYGAVGVAMAFLGFGVWSLVGGVIAQHAVKSAIFLIASPGSARLRFEYQAFSDLLRFGAGYTAFGLGTFVAMQGGDVIVARFLGAAALGFYGRAYELMMAPVRAIGELVNKVLFPALSSMQDDRPKLVAAYRRAMALTALVVLPMSAAMFVLAPSIVLTLLGPQWTGSIDPFRILSVAVYFQIGSAIAQSVTTAAGAVYRSAWRSGLHALLVLVGVAIGQRWGLSGVAVGIAIAMIGNFVAMTQLAVGLTSLRAGHFLIAHAPAIALSALTMLATWLVSRTLSDSLPAVVVLASSTMAAIATVLIAVRMLGRHVLGSDGVWLVESVRHRAPRALRPILSWVAGAGAPG